MEEYGFPMASELRMPPAGFEPACSGFSELIGASTKALESGLADSLAWGAVRRVLWAPPAPHLPANHRLRSWRSWTRYGLTSGCGRRASSRRAGTAAVLGGRVHVNGERVKPSKVVRAGDTVEVTIGTVRRTVAVNEVAERRGPASAAATMYAETPESRTAREQHALERRLARPLGADLGARPTKQARRRLDALRRAQRRGR
jgi:ribosome-associated heat shock protein Hsp15